MKKDFSQRLVYAPVLNVYRTLTGTIIARRHGIKQYSVHTLQKRFPII